MRVVGSNFQTRSLRAGYWISVIFGLIRHVLTPTPTPFRAPSHFSLSLSLHRSRPPPPLNAPATTPPLIQRLLSLFVHRETHHRFRPPPLASTGYGDSDVHRQRSCLSPPRSLSPERYTLNIWDVGGQKTIRSYWRNYFEETDGLVWVVDSSDLRRLDDCKMELDNLLKEERLSGSSLLILANKQDIKGALTPEEIAKVLNLEAMDKTRHWKIVGCSAITGVGLLEGFDWLVQDIASRIYVLD